MPIAIECGDCGKRYAVDERAVGRKVKCRHCGNVFTADPAPRGQQAAPAQATLRPPVPPAPAPTADDPADFDAIMALAGQASGEPAVGLPTVPPAGQPFASAPPAPGLSARLAQVSPGLASIVIWVVILLGLCLSMEVFFYWQNAFAAGFFFAVLDGLLLLGIGSIGALVALIGSGLKWDHLKGPVILSGCGIIVLCTSMLFVSASGIWNAATPSKASKVGGTTPFNAPRSGGTTPFNGTNAGGNVPAPASRIQPQPAPANTPTSLLANLSSTDYAVKQRALMSLPSLSPDDRRAQVATILEDLVINDFRFSDLAAKALATWFGPNTFDRLVPLLKGRGVNFAQRGAAIRAIGATRDPRASPLLVAALHDIHRNDAKAALIQLGQPAEDALLDGNSVFDPDPTVRTAAIEVLDEVGTAKCVPILEQKAADRLDPVGANFARIALPRIKARLSGQPGPK